MIMAPQPGSDSTRRIPPCGSITKAPVARASASMAVFARTDWGVGIEPRGGEGA